MLKKISLSFFLIAVSLSALLAQSISTYSPYSRYGIGEMKTKGFTQQKAMGGLAQPIRNPYGVNYLNPASYSAQDTMSFILDFGFEAGGVQYKTSTQDRRSAIANLDHLAIQFPVTKRGGISLGFVPYSQVGYEIKQRETNPYLITDVGLIDYIYSGSGGINKLYAGFAIEPLEFLSVGANLSYLFGSMDYEKSMQFPANVPYASTYRKTSVTVSDVSLNFGVQASFFVNKEKKQKMIIGATLDNETNLGAKRIDRVFIQYQTYQDTVNFDESSKSSLKLPRNVSAGVSFMSDNKLLAGFEYSYQDWSKAIFVNNIDSLQSSHSFRVGLEYTPNRYDLKSYLKRVSYRAGFHTTSGYVKLRDNQINNYGITFGVGLPFRNTNTSFNLSVELGQRGTTANSLVKESYSLVNFSVVFYDFWFFKRKYN
ncbi:MAG: hypothetical protein JW783_07035 [Bacteroidales bacterium]|nr:hypothetical protein [Bacteroidales bacterium]MBN2750879.1 hypothetical protein [Bacteroidales bacterium]